MKYLFLILTIIPFSSLLSQNTCCDLHEKSRKQFQHFEQKLNRDSNNFVLIVIDTATSQPLFEYDFHAKNPLLNLKGDKYNQSYYTKRKVILSNLVLKRLETKRDTTHKKKQNNFSWFALGKHKSYYYFKNFQLDTLHTEFKDLIQDLDFPYCSDFLYIKVNSSKVFLNKNILNTTLTSKTNLLPYHYAVIQNSVNLHSCSNVQTKRKLDILNSNGQLFTINERYEVNNTPKFTHGKYFGLNENDFDIIELDDKLIFITYVDKKIKAYDLFSNKLIMEFDTKRRIPYPYKSLAMNEEAIIFIPKPIRVGGYDMKKHRGFKGNHIDYSRIKDYDDSKKEIIVWDLSKNNIYKKIYRVDEIEKIKDFEVLNIIFSSGVVENIKETFELVKP